MIKTILGIALIVAVFAIVIILVVFSCIDDTPNKHGV